MIRKEKCKISERKRRIHKFRTRITFIFFVIVSAFMLLSFALIYTAEQLGFSVENIKAPWMWIFLICLLSVVLSSLGTILLVTKIFAPLELISKATKKVAEGDFSVQLSYNGGLEELQDTIQNFNHMIKELNSVEIMRNDFIADVSHEFKTPLSAISGYATFLQDPELSKEETNEYIHKIFFNIDKLNDLTENILRLSKLERQQYLDEPVQFRLDEQIRETIVLLEPKWGKKRTNFVLELQEVSYLGQQSLLFQVWVNLIGNAIKYTDMDGSIEVYLKKRKDFIQILVSDNGIGMTEETQAHIFDKFYQADTSRKSQGDGLGLALCREIISKCGGEIHVVSTVGVGSVFAVNLPLENENLNKI